MPRHGVVAWALQRGHLEPPAADEVVLLAVDDAFRKQVARDVTGTCHDTHLREPASLERWRTARLELKDVTNRRVADARCVDNQTRHSWVRFAVDARLSEQRGLLLRVKDAIHTRLEEQ